MAIKIKTIERGEPGVAGGGQKKFYASPALEGELTLNNLTKAIEKMCTVNGADIRAVLYAMVDVAVDNLAEGRIVRLGDLGSLRPTISSEGKEKAEDVSANCIKSANVIFTPGARIKDMLETVKFQKE